MRVETADNQTNDFPDEWYEIAGEDNFWMLWRNGALKQFLTRANLSTETEWRGLDIGCGQGENIKLLRKFTRWSIEGCDINEGAIPDASSSVGQPDVRLYDIHDRDAQLENAYDFIILFDIIEHIENVHLFLDDALYHVRPGGYVFVNVPALPSLISRYDTVAGHLRRYSQKSLRLILENVGLSIIDIKYWGGLLLPLAILRKFFLAYGVKDSDVIRRGFQPPTPGFNKLLRNIGALELMTNWSPPLGTSVMAIAQKSE
ncbi:MAG: class I SAM-dependent methyltransferase [Planctomycetes bacterium]|nr:class I SAM-dependent methyltransferase [Planctomycetota bacterium]